MNKQELARRALALVKVAADTPFFPGGKAKFELPDTSPKGMPAAPWNTATRGQAFQMKPEDIIAPYYKNTPGGYTGAAASAEKNFKSGPGVWRPNYEALSRSLSVRPGNSDMYKVPNVHWSGAATLSDLNKSQQYNNKRNMGRANKGQLDQRDYDWIDSSHYKNPRDMWTTFKNGTPSALEHELGHGYIEGNGRNGLATRQRMNAVSGRAISDSTQKAHGYFDDPVEEDQGLSRTKRETAALTGQRVDAPADFKRLLNEVNPQDPSQGKFDARIQKYSPEGQRYWRYLRKNKDDADYYQKAVERGADRMPLLVQSKAQAAGGAA